MQALADAEAEFVLIGGWAAILNGSATVTRDLDVCYARSAMNHRKIAAALSPFKPRPREFPPGLPFVWDAATLNNASVLTLETSAGPIDLLAEVAGIGQFQAVKATAKLVSAFDRDVWTLDLRGLIAAKRAAGRPKDLLILPELEGLLEGLED